jgi:DNA polymerase-3 subunit beta
VEITFARDVLYNAVHAVSIALQEKTPRPALQCIHFEVKGTKVTLSATDLTVAVRTTVEALRVSGDGVALIHGTRLAGLLRDVPVGNVQLKFDGGRADLKAGKSLFKLTSQAASEYPQLPAFNKPMVRMRSDVFGEMVRRTVFAVASEQGRYAIDGVSLKVAAGRMELAGTDGRRLAVASRSVVGTDDMPQIVIAPKVLSEVRKLSEGAQEIELAVDGGMFLAKGGGTVVAGALIEGAFPKYSDMIPKESGHGFTVAADELAAALRQAVQLTADESRAVTFHLGKGTLRLESRSAAVGEASIEVDVAYDGEPMVVAFNARFLLDVVGEYSGEKMLIDLERPERPAAIRREGFVYVVAPVRTNDTAEKRA